MVVRKRRRTRDESLERGSVREEEEMLWKEGRKRKEGERRVKLKRVPAGGGERGRNAGVSTEGEGGKRYFGRVQEGE